jgi:hypothetical protein
MSPQYELRARSVVQNTMIKKKLFENSEIMFILVAKPGIWQFQKIFEAETVKSSNKWEGFSIYLRI